MVENMMAVMRRNQERKDREAADAERSISRKNTGKYSKIPEGAELRGGAKDYVNLKNDYGEGTGTVINLSASDTPTPVKKPSLNTSTTKKTTVVKPVSKPRSSSKYRNGYSESDIQAMIDKADNGKTAAFNEATNAYLAKQNPDATTAEDMNMQSKPDTPSVPMAEDTVGGNAMKKGGMTKRPPKPAKKVPPRKFASGGSTSRTSASKRGDGCATKGHTKGKYC
jgi:hypothetical protein